MSASNGDSRFAQGKQDGILNTSVSILLFVSLQKPCRCNFFLLQ